MKEVLVGAAVIATALVLLGPIGAQAQKMPTDLTTLQIEDLMDVNVTSASKKEQKISKVAAAIFVISEEDIYRSGATNIPDLLRMVPGLEVAQITPSTWAISARGFNGEYSTKLLVLIDGRAVYSPLFSGVYWNAQDVPLDSIGRIEVIRGPGAAVWGTNAVNGVINIITKSTRDTQHGLFRAEAGTLMHGGGLVRYGARMGNRGAYTLFVDGFQTDHFLTPDHQSAKDDWYRFHGGLRIEEDLSARDSLTFEGEAIRGNAGEMATTIVSLLPPANATVDLRDRFSGWSALARWKREMSPRSETSLQVYFDRSTRSDTTQGVGLNTFDADFQHHVNWGRRQDMVWGLGYRLNSDQIDSDFRLSTNPPALVTQIFSSFLQDEIAIVPDRLYVTLGAKLEHNYFNGFNLQPTARIRLASSDRSMFWAAISGAQRTPSVGEATIRENETVLPGPNNLPLLISVFGNPKLGNERLIATEAGYRRALSDRLSFDATAFFNRYHNLRSGEPGAARLETDPAPVHLLLPYFLANLVHGETHGFELFAHVKLSNQWTISPGYSFLALHMHTDPASHDLTTGPQIEGDSPGQQAQLRSQVNLPRRLQWTTSAYFVGRLTSENIPSYTRLDSNLAWQASEKVSLGIVGQNLLRDLHQEYAGPDLTELPSLIRRSAYVRLEWRF